MLPLRPQGRRILINYIDAEGYLRVKRSRTSKRNPKPPHDPRSAGSAPTGPDARASGVGARTFRSVCSSSSTPSRKTKSYPRATTSPGAGADHRASQRPGDEPLSADQPQARHRRSTKSSAVHAWRETQSLPGKQIGGDDSPADHARCDHLLRRRHRQIRNRDDQRPRPEPLHQRHVPQNAQGPLQDKKTREFL
jgi:hypothetical protein